MLQPPSARSSTRGQVSVPLDIERDEIAD